MTFDIEKEIIDSLFFSHPQEVYDKARNSKSIEFMESIAEGEYEKNLPIEVFEF